MSSTAAAPAAGPQDINSALNQAVTQTHLPVPDPTSSLNIEARDWWVSSIALQESDVGQKRAHTSDGSLEVPPGWPKDVVLLTQNLVAASVPDTIAQRYVLCPVSSPAEQIAGPSSEKDLPRATHNDGHPELLYTTSIQDQVSLVIHPIDERTAWCPESFHSTSRNLTCHPAAGSHGLFAAQEIAYDTFIRPYLGVLHTKADADFYSTYDLSLCHDPRLSRLPQQDSPPHPDASQDIAAQVESLSLHPDRDQEQADSRALYIDSRFWGNESRFVNDYRGIADKPNVDFRSFVQVSDGEERFQMGLFATRPIRKGQELVINYGKSFWIHYEQLAEIERAKADKDAQSVATSSSNAQTPAGQKLDPIQAMLARSRMRVSRTAFNPRPPHQPSRT